MIARTAMRALWAILMTSLAGCTLVVIKGDGNSVSGVGVTAGLTVPERQPIALPRRPSMRIEE